MTSIKHKLCDIQGRLFESFTKTNYSMESLVKTFMNSELAKNLDSEYNRMQWAGEEYILEEVASAVDEELTTGGEIYPKDVLYWIGYIYRYWHFYNGEDSAKIYKQAPVETMNRNYLMFHTMAPTLAIEDLKEIYNQTQ